MSLRERTRPRMVTDRVCTRPSPTINVVPDRIQRGPGLLEQFPDRLVIAGRGGSARYRSCQILVRVVSAIDLFSAITLQLFSCSCPCPSSYCSCFCCLPDRPADVLEDRGS